MDLTQLREKLPVFSIPLILLVVVIIIVASLVFRAGKQQRTPAPTPTPESGFSLPTTTPIPGGATKVIPPKEEVGKLSAEVKEIRRKIISGYIANQGGDLLLYKTDSFEIEYIPPGDIFFVKIYQDPAAEAKKQAQNWFTGFGLKQEDLCGLPVRFFLSSFELKKTNPNFNILPDGCS